MQDSVPSCRRSGWPRGIWLGGEQGEGGDTTRDQGGVQCAQVGVGDR